MINNRKNDNKVERGIAAFLDEHLYSNQDIFTEFARTDTYEEQISGSDVLLTSKNGKLNRSVVDEKVASRYANCNLNTFSLELSFIGKNGQKRCGWLIDESKKTEYYLFGWIIKANIPFNEERNRFDTDSINKDNIEELEWALVSKKKIISFLEKKGWTLEKLAKQDERIRENKGVKTKEFIDGVSFRYSDAYIEKPINIILKKEDYIKMSTLNGIISTKKQ